VVAVEGDDDAVVDGGEPFGQVVDAEQGGEGVRRKV
jgi:hypothetical protein